MTCEERRSDWLGSSPVRLDARAKVTGRARYVDDIVLPGMLHAALATSAHPHAALDAIDTRTAEAAPGVRAVFTFRDVPGENQVGCVLPDQPLLVENRARMVADRLAIVVAATAAEARAAAATVTADYRPLPVVTCPVAALEPDAPKVHDGGNLIEHKRVRKGDPAAGFEAADTVVTETYRSGYQEHAYLETNGVVAVPESDGSVTIHGSMQCPFYVQKAVARVLGLPLARVRVVQTETGGAFGGKEDYPSEPAACAAVAAWRTGRPVKLVFDRREDMIRSTKRHRMVIREKLGARSDGTLTAAWFEIWVDAGGYDGLSRIVAERSNVSALGPYRCPNVRVDTYIVYTNNLFGGAFRGFGTPQTTFASESLLDRLAGELGLSPVELRRRNLVAEGDTTVSGQVLDESTGAREALETALTRSGYHERRAAAREKNAAGGPLRHGVGLANVMYGCCLHAGGQHLEGSAAYLHLRADGSLELAIGGTEIGQGAFTAVGMLAAKELGIPLGDVRVVATDTALVADSGPTVASRTTLMSGNAVLDAARRIRKRLLDLAAELTATPAGELTLSDGEVVSSEGATLMQLRELATTAYARKLDLSANGWYAPPPKDWDNATGQGEAYAVYCYGTQVAEVEVDLFSGQVRVVKVTAVHGVGRVVNAQQLEGQVEGGVVQGMGWALMEDLQMKEGVPQNPTFTDYLIPTTLDAPEVDTAFVEDAYSAGPYGAKGIGEPALIPTAAAIASAVRNATGLPLTELPITPERLLLASREQG